MLGSCAALAWHVVQAAWPLPLLEPDSRAWHFAHSAGSSLGLAACGAWQSMHYAVA